LLSPDAPNHYADIELATVQKFSQDAKTKMLRLLLALTSEPVKGNEISEFAARFLKGREDIVIQPSKLDY
jgi:hypothetical protein